MSPCLEYDFLYDSKRKLLSIGYNVDENRRDASYYDLLASEARLAVFVGIAQGHLPQESWFSLGRLLATTTSQKPVLLSWSGSMFEYLMPLLVMPFYENSLLDQSCKAAVAAQIEYGKKCGLPWGISESSYCMTDARADYMYKAFGVPGLGIKRDLTADLVVAPYASALAAMIAPRDACLNLERLSQGGVEGEYGMYEAIDYTASRLPRGEAFEIVRSYMGRSRLSGRNGVGLDPCAVIQVPFTLAAGEERVITFRLGVGKSKDECRELAMRFKGLEATQESLSRVWRQWDHLLGSAYVETPDTSFNVMANGWLLYQAIVCRMWGRGAIYQSGGAFGFRDQLQDAMALVHTAPHLLREHILLCASRQFVEGDVMHWWHPPSGRGVRTHCSDDYLWLPQAVCRYVSSTQDTGILDEQVALIMKTHFLCSQKCSAILTGSFSVHLIEYVNF